MDYKIRKLKTVGLRQGAPGTVSLEWYPPALRKTATAIAGFGVLIVGVAFIFLPAPSIVVIPLGLAILAREFPWARKALDWSNEHARRSWIAVRDRLATVGRSKFFASFPSIAGTPVPIPRKEIKTP